MFGAALARMAPGLALEDSGEFATAAATLTLTHPPGYPLYLLLGRLALCLPAGNPAYRLSLLSAAATGIAAVSVAAAARLAGGARPFAAAACGLAVAWAPAAALQSVLADKYALNLGLLAALLLAGWLAWRDGGRAASRWALLAGLSLSHHAMTLYVAPAAAGWLIRKRIWRTPRRLAVLALLAFLPLSLKPVGLPLLSRTAPSLMYAPVTTRDWLVRYLTAKDYEGRFAAYGPAERLHRIWSQGAVESARQAGGPLLVLAALGAAALAAGGAAGPVLAGLAGVIFALLLVARFQIAGVGYYLSPVVAFAGVLAGAGLAAADRRGGRLLATGLAVVLATLAGIRGLPGTDISNYYGATDWGRSLLASLPHNGVLVSWHDDDFYPPMYVQRVLHEREGVVLVHRPFLTRVWHHRQVQALHPGFTALDPALIPWGRTLDPEGVINLFIRSQLPRRPLAFSFLATAECAGGFLLRPEGCAFRCARRETEPPLATPDGFANRLRRFPWRMVRATYPEGSRFREVASAPGALWTQLALRHWNQGDPGSARVCLARAAALPNVRVSATDWVDVRRLIGRR